MSIDGVEKHGDIKCKCGSGIDIREIDPGLWDGLEFVITCAACGLREEFSLSCTEQVARAHPQGIRGLAYDGIREHLRGNVTPD